MQVFTEQRIFYQTGRTRSLTWRKEQLRRLLLSIEEHEEELYQAFYQDLHKSRFETFITEIGATKKALRHALKHLDRWAKPRRVRTPLTLLGCSSFIVREPYGNVLILGPFNYPFLTLIEPLIGAICAGNTAVIKPSEQTPNVGRVISKIIASFFPPHYIACLEGDAELSARLCALPFDLIFFTGSTRVGKQIMEAAAKNLSPVVLELGGKSPAILCKDADVKRAAERIAWGKFLNAGQTCVAPDYCLVYEPIKDAFLEALKREIRKLYGADASASEDYVRIVSHKHADRLRKIIQEHKTEIVYGGNSHGRYVEPTVLNLKDASGPAMEEELFGPILPVIGYRNRAELFAVTSKHPNPLALYVFGNQWRELSRILARVPSGGAMINDVILHLANEHLPFGGVGNSGIGSYHGIYSMKAFSHERALVKRRLPLFESLLRAPYSDKKLGLLQRFLR